MKESEYIAGFLSYLREAVTRYNIAEADEKEANAQTQDILHRLELYDDVYSETERLGELLRQVRRKRRKAKNARETLAPVADWAKDNEGFISRLNRTLGEVRKVEERQAIRAYIPRTDILEQPSTVEPKEVEDHDL